MQGDFPSENEDHFWKLNSPTSDHLENFKFDYSGQQTDSFLDTDFSFLNSPTINYGSSDANTIPTHQTENTMDDFFSPEFSTQNNPPPYSITTSQSQIPNSNENSQINILMSDSAQLHSFNFPIQPNPINPTTTAESSHRRTPSTPANLLQFNLALQALQQNVQQQNQRQSSTNLQQLHQLQQLLEQDLQFPQIRNRKMSSQPLPSVPSISSIDEEFNTVCDDKEIKFNPHKLGFIPQKFWPNKDFTFGELVRDFFQKKNNANSRFYHKLYNALKISEDDPFYSIYLGIEWINDQVLKVDKKKFARLLGIKTIDGSLFHQQGNFPSHGFIELATNNALNYVSERDLTDVDYENIRLLVHQAGVFVRGCTEEAIEGCRWVSARKRH